MATQIQTTQRVAYFDCPPEQARQEFKLAWAHGECILRVEEIDAVPFARIVSGEYAGQSGKLLGQVYDLTHEKYDRWYFAFVEGVTNWLGYEAFVSVADIEIDEVPAMQEP